MNKKNFFLPVLIVILTINTGIQWLTNSVTNTGITWGVEILVILSVILNKRKYSKKSEDRFYTVTFYSLYFIISIIRGILIIENYWEWKQLIEGSTALFLPILVYVFSIPSISAEVLRYWLRYALPLFIFFIFLLPNGAFHFYLGPILLIGSFIYYYPTKWKIVFFMLLLLMVFADFGARSQVIKSVLSLSITLFFLINRKVSYWLIKYLQATFIIIPLILLYLGLSGIFNPFKDLSEKNTNRYVESKVVNGKIVEDDLAADTRTFIYEEVISSAVLHEYILLGRTPARGNDSRAFGAHLAEVLHTGKYERHSNELCFTNVFTWLGIVGLMFYCFIYIQSSFLAVYKSKSFIMKLIGLCISFHFMYGWIEDFNKLDIMNVSLWILISMGLSKEFRAMNEEEITAWFRGLL